MIWIAEEGSDNESIDRATAGKSPYSGMLDMRLDTDGGIYENGSGNEKRVEPRNFDSENNAANKSLDRAMPETIFNGKKNLDGK